MNRDLIEGSGSVANKIASHLEQLRRDDLIKFFLWFRNNGEALIGLSVEQLIDQYLKETNNNEIHRTDTEGD